MVISSMRIAAVSDAKIVCSKVADISKKLLTLTRTKLQLRNCGLITVNKLKKSNFFSNCGYEKIFVKQVNQMCRCPAIKRKASCCISVG